jgi:hypothetical protein
VGVAAGTAAGALITKSATGAVVGALVGGLLGGVIGHYAYDKQKSREQTAEDYGYETTDGTVLRIEEVSANPGNIPPGQTLNLNLTYALLTPDGDQETSITESREITHNGELIGRPEVRVERVDGTYTSTIPIQLPANAEKGVYKVVSTVQSANASDAREMSFTVE